MLCAVCVNGKACKSWRKIRAVKQSLEVKIRHKSYSKGNVLADGSAFMLHMWRVQGSSLCPYTAMRTVYRRSVQSLLVQSATFPKIRPRPFECTIYFSFFPSQSELLYLRIVGTEGYCCNGTYSDTHTHTVRLLCTRDRPVAETLTQRNTTLTSDRHSCSRRYSKPQSQ
jgi:hypothetical protein